MIMAKKIQTKKNLEPNLATEGSSKSSSVVNGGRVSNLDDRDYDDFLEYVFLSPSTAVILAEAISWAEILDG
jgi:hypothetical protein